MVARGSGRASKGDQLGGQGASPPAARPRTGTHTPERLPASLRLGLEAPPVLLQLGRGGRDLMCQPRVLLGLALQDGGQRLRRPPRQARARQRASQGVGTQTCAARGGCTDGAHVHLTMQVHLPHGPAPLQQTRGRHSTQGCPALTLAASCSAKVALLCFSAAPLRSAHSAVGMGAAVEAGHGGGAAHARPTSDAAARRAQGGPKAAPPLLRPGFDSRAAGCQPRALLPAMQLPACACGAGPYVRPPSARTPVQIAELLPGSGQRLGLGLHVQLQLRSLLLILYNSTYARERMTALLGEG